MTAVARFVLIGHPVGHSVSPALHAAAYKQAGVSATYRALDCPDPSSVERVFEELRSGLVQGANVTIPHKRLALELADAVAPSAQRIGAANVLVVDPAGRVTAHNTDAPALAQRIKLGARVTPKSVLVLGGGGAALAAVVAAQLAGAERVWVSTRRYVPQTDPWPAASEFRARGVLPVYWGDAPANELGTLDVAPEADAIVQASSAGMLGVGDGESVCAVVPWSALKPTAFCYDAVYNPPVTPFLERARRRGLAAEGGLSMLVEQAALAIELWLGVAPERDAMMAAASRALFDSDQEHR